MSKALPPNNILMLALIGGGAYWFLTRRAVASPGAARPASASRPSGASDLLGMASRFFTGAPNLQGTYDGRAAQPWDVTPAGPGGPQFNNPSAYVPPAYLVAADGLAYNPPTVSAYDAAAFGTGADYGSQDYGAFF